MHIHIGITDIILFTLAFLWGLGTFLMLVDAFAKRARKDVRVRIRNSHIYTDNDTVDLSHDGGATWNTAPVNVIVWSR